MLYIGRMGPVEVLSDGPALLQKSAGDSGDRLHGPMPQPTEVWRACMCAVCFACLYSRRALLQAAL